jgi:hypothetical protein
MKTVEVSLQSLKKLIKDCYETDIHDRAQRAVLIQAQNANPSGAFQFAHMVEAEKPAAEKAVYPRYRELINALESGNCISEAFVKFTG